MSICSGFIKINSQDLTIFVSSYPGSNNVSRYKNLLLANGVTYIINFCDNTSLNKILPNITFINMPIRDGSYPDLATMTRFYEIIENLKKMSIKSVLLQCLSGLGRAPMMACLILMKNDKLNSIDAIEYVRKAIPHCLNTKQIEFLESREINKNKHRCILL